MYYLKVLRLYLYIILLKGIDYISKRLNFFFFFEIEFLLSTYYNCLIKVLNIN